MAEFSDLVSVVGAVSADGEGIEAIDRTGGVEREYSG